MPASTLTRQKFLNATAGAAAGVPIARFLSSSVAEAGTRDEQQFAPLLVDLYDYNIEHAQFVSMAFAPQKRWDDYARPRGLLGAPSGVFVSETAQQLLEADPCADKPARIFVVRSQDRREVD